MSLEQYLTSYYLDECKLLADFRNTWYKVVGLEITRYRTLSKLQDDKKNDSSEADIDEIIELYTELRDQVSQYIGFKPNEIRLPITKEDRWLFTKKVLINPPEDLSEKVLAHIQKRFEEVPLAPVLIVWNIGDIKELVTIGAVAGKDTASALPTEII
ncbi:hypothetical protein RhiirC2_784328 [Rhizophagus irregularis]|uniref:Uncharacterized protein n=1 Tax=Rhizophagus irregularis TaxID=588596 RepID=A0A2N1MYV2_9GLOM|nr:hypothetical protein RhiirC2_784328 [Rhizophagus irregularis]